MYGTVTNLVALASIDMKLIDLPSLLRGQLMAFQCLPFKSFLTLFDMRGMMAPQNVFDHCAQTLRRRKLKLGDL